MISIKSFLVYSVNKFSQVIISESSFSVITTKKDIYYQTLTEIQTEERLFKKLILQIKKEIIYLYQ